MADKPRYYLTTAIAYPNGAPHIGHAYEAIATDAIARFKRLDGYDVFFLTGTDEHGIKMLQTAAKEKHHAARTGRAQRAALPGHGRSGSNCSNDDFIRTTEERHHRASQAIWERMAKPTATSISTSIPAGTRCATRPITTRTRPQLDEQGVRLGPQGTPVEWVEEESYFFRLSAYQDKLLELYARYRIIVLPKERLNEVRASSRAGCRTFRSRAPRSTGAFRCQVAGHDPKHVMYVWVDALTNYITARRLSRHRQRGSSAATGRPICTSSARTSCASTRSTGRPS